MRLTTRVLLLAVIHVVMTGKLFADHCPTPSVTPWTIDGQWLRAYVNFTSVCPPASDWGGGSILIREEWDGYIAPYWSPVGMDQCDSGGACQKELVRYRCLSHPGYRLRIAAECCPYGTHTSGETVTQLPETIAPPQPAVAELRPTSPVSWDVWVSHGPTDGPPRTVGWKWADSPNFNWKILMEPGSVHPNPVWVDGVVSYAPAVIEGWEKQCEIQEVSSGSVSPTDSCPFSFGAPILPQNGAQRYAENDLLPETDSFSLTRYYNSAYIPPTGRFGNGWWSPFDAKLVVEGVGVTGRILLVNDRYEFLQFIGGIQHFPRSGERNTMRADGSDLVVTETSGRETYFSQQSDGSWRATKYRRIGSLGEIRITYNGSIPVSLLETSSGTVWTITTVNAKVTQISVDGNPALTRIYEYGGSNELAKVRINGEVYRMYEYQSQGQRLSVVRGPDGTPGGYTIEEHAYDQWGRSTTSFAVDGEFEDVSYTSGRTPSETKTVARRRVGSQTTTTTFYTRFIAGEFRVVEVEGASCSTCGGGANVYAYDERGNKVMQQDQRGYVTLRDYDSQNRLQSLRTAYLPLGCDPNIPGDCRRNADTLPTQILTSTAESTLVTYAYQDVTWPNKVTSTTTESVLNPAASRTESWTYTIDGETLQQSVSGYTTVSTTETHTTTNGYYNGTESAAFNPGSWFTWSGAQPLGVLKSVNGPRTDVADETQFVYYPMNNGLLSGKLAAIKDAAGNITRYEDYDVFGNARKITDPNGVVTLSTYDALGRLLTSTTKGVTGCDTSVDPLCATDLLTTNLYRANGVGALERTTSPAGGVTVNTYDSRGRLATTSRGPLATDLRERIEHTYIGVASEREKESIQAFEGGAWVEKKSTRYAFDAEGRVTRTYQPPYATPVENGPHEELTYDEAGNVIAVKDARHSFANTKYAYDGLGRLKSVQQYFAPAGWIETSYQYDKHSNLKQVTDPNGNVTAYTYDDFGRMIEQSSPVTGTTTYQYDAAGNLTSTTDARGATTTRTYDALGRPLSAVSTFSGAPTETVSWTYDNNAANVFGLGRVATMTDPSGTTTYRYDRRGLLRYESRTISGTTFTSQFQYNADGVRSKITYPSNLVATYTLDYAGRPTTLTGKYGTGGGQPTTIVSAASYLPFGPAKSVTFGAQARTMTYDQNYRLQTNVFAKGTTQYASYGYTYDDGGNILTINDALNASYNRTFGYDDLSRLTSANSGASLWGSGGYGYDAMGNMLSSTMGALTNGFSYSGTTPKITTVDRTATSQRSVTYDSAGNESGISYSSGGTQSEIRRYSARNLLRDIQQTTTAPPAPCCYADYLYDGRNVRVRANEYQSLGGTLVSSRSYVYSPELQLLSRKEGTAAAMDILWLNGEPVAQWSSGGALRLTFTDHLGTPLLQTSTTNNPSILWRAEYDPYGNVYVYRNGTKNDQILRLPGQEYAWTTKGSGEEEMYNIFRWYRSGWGRYSQVDPLVSSVALEPYPYAAANPLVYSDPLGLYSVSDEDRSKCRVFRKQRLKKVMDRARQNQKCRDFFSCRLNSDLDRLLDDPEPVLKLRRAPGGGFDQGKDPTTIYIGRTHCRNANNFAHILIHELAHFADANENQNHMGKSEGCAAELECFGTIIATNCQDEGFTPPRARRRR